jgi:hypothetical protein
MKNRGEIMFLPREFVRYPLTNVEFRLFAEIYLTSALDVSFCVPQEKIARKFQVGKRAIGDALEILSALRMIKKGELINEFREIYEYCPLEMNYWVEPVDVEVVREKVKQSLLARREAKRRGRSRPKLVALQNSKPGSH